MRDDMDAACKDAKFWPDAVLSGHAHLYQAAVRTVQDTAVPGGVRQIPYVVSGSGGYDDSHKKRRSLESERMGDPSDPEFRLQQVLAQFGYLWLQVKVAGANGDPTLRVEFRSPALNGGDAAHAFVLNLKTHRLL